MASKLVLFPEDLALARGCAAGNPEALATFERTLMPKATAAAAGILANSSSQGELEQTLRVHLFVRHSSAPPRIAEYNGTAPLAAWIRVIARRCALNLRESIPQWAEPAGLGVEGLVMRATADDDLARQRFRECFRAAFVEVIQALGQRERATLRQHYVDGVNQDDIARAYGVHRTTVVRWIATARAMVIGKTRERLTLMLGPSVCDLDSLLRSAFSNIDVSISAAFREPLSPT
jgi:RNA polymerase sigma-70 factor (ECF subfamily)